jgi:hypothetical protein
VLSASKIPITLSPHSSRGAILSGKGHGRIQGDCRKRYANIGNTVISNT